MDNLLQLANSALWDSINQKHQAKGGVYKIIAMRNGLRQPINRFLGTDNSGVLYIGKATSFIDRVIALKKSISPQYNGRGHICGRRYKSNPNISKQFPYETLFIEFVQSDAPVELERKLLNKYFEEFGEVPPLNAI